MKTIDPKNIVCDPALHSRATIREDLIADYVEDMKRGDEFPPVLAYWDGTNENYILADGFHRFHAWQRIDPNGYIPARLKLGTKNDARWASICANQNHGFRRTNGDKRRSVELALIHPRGVAMSNRLLARFTGVDESTVRSVRREMEDTARIPQITRRTGANGCEIETVNIGASQSDCAIRHCSECRLYLDGRCMFSARAQKPNTPSCPEFIAPEPQRNEPTPDRSNIQYLIPQQDKTPRRTNELHCRKAGSVQVHVYADNPTLSAVELRHMLGNEWIAELYAAIHSLVFDEYNNDRRNQTTERT